MFLLCLYKVKNIVEYDSIVFFKGDLQLHALTPVIQNSQFWGKNFIRLVTDRKHNSFLK